MGRQRAVRVHRPTSSSGRAATRSWSSPWPGRSSSTGGPTGAAASATSRASTSSRSARMRCGRCSTGSSRACPSRPSGRSSPGPKGSRCMPSRRSGCWSPTTGSSARATSTSVRGALDRLSVPETLHALVAARLDGLDPTRPVAPPGCLDPRAELHRRRAGRSRGWTRRELDGRLAGLVNRELLRVEVDPRSPERGQYLFVQAVIREVAYGTLTKRERRARHLAAAQYFETLGDDELASILACHYLDAYRNATPGRRGRHAGRPGSGRAPRRGRSGDPAPLVRPGDVATSPGAGGHRRPRSSRRAQRTRRRGGDVRRHGTRGLAPARGSGGGPSGGGRPARRGAGLGRTGQRRCCSTGRRSRSSSC